MVWLLANGCFSSICEPNLVYQIVMVNACAKMGDLYLCSEVV